LNEFEVAFTVFEGIAYDPLDPSDRSFLYDYDVFKSKIEDLDHKLAAIFSQAFEDCYNLENLYKVCGF
jgi:Dynein heavy chain, N-terminal region 1.